MKGCAKCMELHCTFDRPMTPSEHSKSQSESNALALEEEAFSGKREREREGERGYWTANCDYIITGYLKRE